jgi:hypothetical protein
MVLYQDELGEEKELQLWRLWWSLDFPRRERYDELTSTVLTLRCPERWTATLSARCVLSYNQA